jgi:AAA domain
VNGDDYDRGAADAEERWHDQLGDMVVTTMSDVDPEDVRWLWGGRIPLGKLTILEGDPKGGKSTLSLDLMARVSTGGVMPDGTPSDIDGAANCVLMTAEDGLADTVRPRLDLAGADASRVMVWEAVLSTTEDRTELRMPSLPLDVVRLEALVTELAAKLVVVDVLAAYLGDRVDNHHDTDVRRALAPLAKMAERTGAAVIVLRHLNKGTGTNAIYRGGGSIGISGQARAILLAGLDPNDEDRRRRVLAVTACNLAAPVSSLTYELVSESERGPVRISWTGKSDLSADDLLLDGGSGDERSDRKEIVDLLTAWTEDGPIAVSDVRRKLRDHDLTPSDTTLQRARRDAGVKVGSPDGFGGKRHYWRPATVQSLSEGGESDRTATPDMTWGNGGGPGPVRSPISVNGLDPNGPPDGRPSGWDPDVAEARIRARAQETPRRIEDEKDDDR